MFVGYLLLSNDTIFIDKHNKLGEFLSEFKPEQKYRIQIAVSFARKVIYVGVLLSLRNI